MFAVENFLLAFETSNKSNQIWGITSRLGSGRGAALKLVRYEAQQLHAAPLFPEQYFEFGMQPCAYVSASWFLGANHRTVPNLRHARRLEKTSTFREGEQNQHPTVTMQRAHCISDGLDSCLPMLCTRPGLSYMLSKPLHAETDSKARKPKQGPGIRQFGDALAPQDSARAGERNI